MNPNYLTLHWISSFLFLSLMSADVSATFIGDTISISAPGIPGDTTNIVASSGTDLVFNDRVGFGTGPDEYISVDIGITNIAVDLFAQDNFWGWQPGIPDDPFTISFTDLDFNSDENSIITSISFVSSGFFASGLSATLVGPKTVNILVPLSSFGESCGGQFCGNISVSINTKTVPEPSSLALFLLAILGVYISNRNKYFV